MSDIEELCEVMHDAYERAAVGAGWETQEASRKPWSDVPEANKATMRVAVQALVDHLEIEQLRLTVLILSQCRNPGLCANCHARADAALGGDGE